MPCWQVAGQEHRLRDCMQTNTTPGAAWVKRFLQPLLVRHFPTDKAVSCAQVAATDPSEAEELRALGHACELLEPTASLRLEARDASFDFAFTGRFPVLAAEPPARVRLARELHRVLRRGGALLLVSGNRHCPLDLTRNGPLLHSPGAQQGLSSREVGTILVKEGGFANVRPLSVCGHFGWNRLNGSQRWVGRVLDAYWHRLATPSRKWLYFSPLNPTLVLWLVKG